MLIYNLINARKNKPTHRKHLVEWISHQQTKSKIDKKNEEKGKNERKWRFRKKIGGEDPKGEVRRRVERREVHLRKEKV